MATQTSASTSDRVHAFDALRAVATVGVVALHGGASIVTRNLDETSSWTDFTTGNAFDSAGRFAVNCFFMISGALLLAPEHSFRLVKQVRRVVVPLLGWSVVYILADAWLASRGRGVVGGSVGEPDLHAPVQLVRDAMAAPVAYHLWFVYVLVGLYLVTPLLRPLTRLADPERRQLLLYAMGLWVVVDVGLRFGPHLWDRFPRVYAGALPDLPLGYLGLFLLGFVLHRYPPPGPTVLYGLLAVAGYAWIVLGASEDRSLWTYNNLQPPVLLFSAAVFVLGLRLLERPGRLAGVGLFSALSYRIYLVHALVLHGLRSFGPTGELYRSDPLVGIPVVVVLTLVVSFAIAWLLEQVRPLRQYV
jgi:surface polysaccharide O-acyltransferase-like enzyme